MTIVEYPEGLGLVRRGRRTSVGIGSSTTNSGMVNMRPFAGGLMRCNTTQYNGSTFKCQASMSTATSDFFDISDEDSASAVGLKMLVPGWNKIPDATFGAWWLRFVADAASTDAAGATLDLLLKG